MKRALPVIINRSGANAAALGDRLAETVATAFGLVGQTVALELVDGSRVEDALRRHAAAPVIAVGGGDGTLALAAKVLAGSATALAILPLGARNELARRLGVPADLEQAAAVCIRGQRRRIDLGVAGDRIFLGEAAFGAAACDAGQVEGGRAGAWLAPFHAVWRVIRHARSRRYDLRVDGDRHCAQSSWLAVAVNRGACDADRGGGRELARERPFGDGGGLTLCAAVKQRPIETIALALRAFFGGGEVARPAANLGDAREIVIESVSDLSGEIAMTLDGEPFRAPLPLIFRSAPGALGFISPRERELSQSSAPLAYHF